MHMPLPGPQHPSLLHWASQILDSKMQVWVGRLFWSRVLWLVDFMIFCQLMEHLEKGEVDDIANKLSTL